MKEGTQGRWTIQQKPFKPYDIELKTGFRIAFLINMTAF